MQIKQMDRRTVQLLSDAITQALQPLAAQYGVKIDRGSASYNDQNFTLKVSVAVIGEGGVAVSKEVTDFKRYAEFKGMKADDLGKTVSLMGKPYTIAGYLVRSTRNPILVKDAKDKSWRMPLYLVTAALDKLRGKVVAPKTSGFEPEGDGMPSISELVGQGFTGENNEDSRAELAFEAKAS
jgi:hypothetical protein